MTIDLLSLVKKVDENYTDVECSFGSIRVYHVPDAVLLSGESVYDEPERPTVSMRTATGTQERPAKKGDPDFDEWQKEVANIREKQFRLRQARGYVMALRDAIDWSQYDISQPPPSKLAQEIYNGHWPKEEVLQKMTWIDFTVFAVREDKEKILAAMNKMNRDNEPTDNMVDEVKKNSASSSKQSRKD